MYSRLGDDTVKKTKLDKTTFIVKVGAGNRITLPSEISNKLCIENGNYLFIEADETKVTIIPAKVIPRIVDDSKEENR